MASNSPQVPDTRPGNYYVTVRDGSRQGLLAGPFVNDHAGALAMVGHAMLVAIERNSMAHFYAFGTGWLPGDRNRKPDAAQAPGFSHGDSGVFAAGESPLTRHEL